MPHARPHLIHLGSARHREPRNRWAICAAAERFGADNTCIDSHTRPGFTAKVLGSVALAVLQTSRRPVLVVRPPTD